MQTNSQILTASSRVGLSHFRRTLSICCIFLAGAVSAVRQANAISVLEFAPSDSVHWNDSLPEPSETLDVKLTGSTGAAGFGRQQTATLSIEDNDQATLERIDPTDTVPENIGQATVTLFRRGDFPDPLTVRCFTSDGTARAGTHYAATSTELTFLPNEPRKSFVIPILDNGLVDGPKTLNVTVANAADGSVLQEFPLTIEDNEMPPGQVDGDFHPRAFVQEPLALQPDGSILVRTDNGMARLKPDGSEDSSFHLAGAFRLDPAYFGEAPIRTALVQANGKIVIAGPFVGIGQMPVSRLARLNSDGTVDASFGAPALDPGTRRADPSIGWKNP